MRRRLPSILLTILALNVMWFVLYSAGLGLQALVADAPAALSRVFAEVPGVTDWLLALHMIAGAVLTLGAPVQALPVLRRRWPGLHRRWGYALLALALVTGCAGLAYIAGRGTVGGWWMSLWFAIYGGLIMVAAANTVYHALNKDMRRHFEWATRFVILAVGSWIFRMHYVLWFALTGGAGSTPGLTGPFDRIQVVAFFVPYLLLAEILLRRGRRRRGVA
ncbi:DUF2306 domain-containing protein [Lutimaribacter marinistellae]|uniref:DUF2306 domain-containing protein n=1 Tax=Lutimaribacter marinistellae TaxID=1820329 RepID=A0ABV7TKU1_9RHOB